MSYTDCRSACLHHNGGIIARRRLITKISMEMKSCRSDQEVLTEAVIPLIRAAIAVFQKLHHRQTRAADLAQELLLEICFCNSSSSVKYTTWLQFLWKNHYRKKCKTCLFIRLNFEKHNQKMSVEYWEYLVWSRWGSACLGGSWAEITLCHYNEQWW